MADMKGADEMAETIPMKKLSVAPDEYRMIANECRESAVAILRDESDPWARSGRLRSAADLLVAADVYERRAAVMENFGHGPDTAQVEDYS